MILNTYTHCACMPWLIEILCQLFIRLPVSMTGSMHTRTHTHTVPSELETKNTVSRISLFVLHYAGKMIKLSFP